MKKELNVRISELSNAIKIAEALVGMPLGLSQKEIARQSTPELILGGIENLENLIAGDLKRLQNRLTNNAVTNVSVETTEHLDSLAVQTLHCVINYTKYISLVLRGYGNKMFNTDEHLTKGETLVQDILTLANNYKVVNSEIENRLASSNVSNRALLIRLESLQRVLTETEKETGIEIPIKQVVASKCVDEKTTIADLTEVKKHIDEVSEELKELIVSNKFAVPESREEVSNVLKSAIRYNLRFMASTVYGYNKGYLKDEQFIGYAEEKVDSTLELKKQLITIKNNKGGQTMSQPKIAPVAQPKQIEEEQQMNQTMNMQSQIQAQVEVTMGNMPTDGNGNYILDKEALSKLLTVAGANRIAQTQNQAPVAPVQAPVNPVTQSQAPVYESISNVDANSLFDGMAEGDKAVAQSTLERIKALEDKIKFAESLGVEDHIAQEEYCDSIEDLNELTGKSISTRVSEIAQKTVDYINNNVATTVENVVCDTGDYVSDLIDGFLDAVVEIKEEVVSPLLSTAFDGTVSTGRIVGKLATESTKRTGTFAGKQIQNITGLIK